MTDRDIQKDRLKEIVKDSLMKHIDKTCSLAENITNDLLANGVIVPPCKVGDTVYKITHLCGGETIIVKGTVIEITMTEKSPKSKKVDCRFYFWADGEEFTRRMYSIWCWWFDIGETVFLTKEEAKAKLKELNNNA